MAHTWWHIWGEIDKRHQQQWNTRDPNQNFYGVNDPRRAVRETTNRWSKKGSEVIDRIPEPVKEVVGGVTNVVGKGLFGYVDDKGKFQGGLLSSDANALGLQPIDALRAVDAGFETTAKLTGINRNVLEAGEALVPFVPPTAKLAKTVTKKAGQKVINELTEAAFKAADPDSVAGMVYRTGGGVAPVPKNLSASTKTTVRSSFNKIANIPASKMEKRIASFKQLHKEANINIRTGKPRAKSDFKTSALGTIEPKFEGDPRLYPMNRIQKLEADIPLELGRADANVLTLHHELQKEITAAYIPTAVKLVESGHGTYADIINLSEIAKSRGYGFGDYGVVPLTEVPHQLSHKRLLEAQIQPSPGPQMEKWTGDIRNLPDMDALTEDFINFLDETADPMRDSMLRHEDAWNKLDLKDRNKLLDYWNLSEDVKAFRKANPNASDDLELAFIQGKAKEQWKTKKDILELQTTNEVQRVKNVETAIEDIKSDRFFRQQGNDIKADYLEWMKELEEKRTIWRSGGGIQSFGRVR